MSYQKHKFNITSSDEIVQKMTFFFWKVRKSNKKYSWLILEETRVPGLLRQHHCLGEVWRGRDFLSCKHLWMHQDFLSCKHLWMHPKVRRAMIRIRVNTDTDRDYWKTSFPLFQMSAIYGKKDVRSHHQALFLGTFKVRASMNIQRKNYKFSTRGISLT